MTRRRVTVGVLLGAGVALVLGRMSLCGPTTGARDDDADGATADTRATGARAPAGSTGRPRAAVRPDGPPRSTSAPRRVARATGPGRAGTDAGPAGGAASNPASGGRPVPADEDAKRPGSIHGHAALPRELAFERDALEMHVVRSVEVEGGVMTASWSVPKVVGADGTYALTDLETGRYMLQLVLRGRAVSEARRLDLDGGQAAGGVDFRFARSVTVHGTVLSDVEFKPVARADVAIVGEPADPTDSSGGFDLFDLPPGPYELFVSHPDFAPAWASFEVPDDAPPPPITVYLRPGAEARVLAADRAGVPMPDVPVDVASEDHLATAVTDRQGVAWVRGLTPGAHYVATVAGQSPESPAIVLTVDPAFPSTVVLTTSR